MQIAFADKLLSVEQALRDHGIPHAFGGAIALNHYAPPRVTLDFDVNLFIEASDLSRLEPVFERLGIESLDAEKREQIVRYGQTFVVWDSTRIDLFFSYDPLHESCARRAREVLVAAGEQDSRRPLTILSPEDLMVFKALFDRPKDWVDIDALLSLQGDTIQTEYVLDWLGAVFDPDDRRIREVRNRFDDLGRGEPGATP